MGMGLVMWCNVTMLLKLMVVLYRYGTVFVGGVLGGDIAQFCG